MNPINAKLASLVACRAPAHSQAAPHCAGLAKALKLADDAEISLGSTIHGLSVAYENLLAAYSAISDVDLRERNSSNASRPSSASAPMMRIASR